jgi:Kef-type K+ transport system membrane component KefB
MHSDTTFIVNLSIILITVGIGSFIAKKMGQPKILGQILGGVIIGPSVLGFVEHTTFISNLAEIGVILLMFLAGLETEYEKLKSSFEQSAWIALGGISIPFILGFLGMVLVKDGVTIQEAVFVGVILTATSMGITIQTLSELGRLKSSFGMSVVGATIIDDVAGVIILAITLGIFGKSSSSVSLLLIKIALFFILLMWLGKVIGTLISKNTAFLDKVKSQYLLSGSFFLALLFAIFAQEFGMAAVIGAYFIGVIISRTQLKHRVIGEIDKFGTGLFIPIFFVNIGLSIDLGQIGNHLGMALMITIVGIVSKIIGSGLGAKISGYKNGECLQIGMSMVPRAEVTLIIANLGLSAGIIDTGVFMGVVLLVITSSVMTPIMIKWVSKKTDKATKANKEPVYE